MDQICFALPIQPGQTEAARAFMRDLEGPRKQDFAASERKLGISKEAWFLQQTPQGDLLIVYMESSDFNRALSSFTQSQEAFDRWFKQEMLRVTGVDFNNPPAGPLSEQLSNYEA